jgi:hypothetical protein
VLPFFAKEIRSDVDFTVDITESRYSPAWQIAEIMLVAVE